MDCIQCGTAFEVTEGSCPQCGWNADLLFDPSVFRPGELIRSRYEFEKPIGTGRLGGVFSAMDLETGEQVAVKVIHHGLIPNEGVGRDFMAGMRAVMRIHHPIMNRVLDVNCEGNRYFMVSNLLEGVPLRDLMESRRVQGRIFTVREIYPIIRQISAFLVESGLDCHGALCPENIWILPENLKILDAGLVSSLPAAAVGHKLCSRSRVRGYVAPEIRRGFTPTCRSDVYSLGVLLGEMVTQATFDGRAEMFHEVDADLPEAVDAILRRSLLADPRGRFADAEELMEDVAALAEAPPPAFQRPQEGTPAAKVSAPVAETTAPPRGGPPRAAPPKRSGDWGLRGVPTDVTVQISMDDLISAHVHNVEQQFASQDSGARPPVRDLVERKPVIAVSTRSSAPPPPPPRRPSTPPPSRKATTPPPSLTRSSAPPPPPPARVQIDDPQPSFVSNFQPPVARRDTIAPKRPSPRKSMPPPSASRFAPPPRKARADDPVLFEEDESTSIQPGVLFSQDQPPRREVTQEIDMEEIEAVSQVSPRREVTQEIDASMLQDQENNSLNNALSKLESQASLAEARSTEELIRRADRLEGVDPRFVRAAHRLESEKRGSHSRQAAEVLRSKADNLDGIDPRFLRAAARLEQARVSDVPITGLHDVEKLRREADENNEDWRDRMEALKEDSVISFIAPPVMTDAGEVAGFPRTQQRGQRSRAAAPSPAPPPAKRDSGRKREPHNHQRALYDDSGETDDESQPTMLVRPSEIPRSPVQAMEGRRLKMAEMAIPFAMALLTAGMIILLAVAAAIS